MPAAPVLASGLAVTSVLLAAPVSAVLARSRWTRRAPRAALVLWQAICLAAGLCMIGAGFVLALEPLGHNIVSALQEWLARSVRGRALVGMTGYGVIAGVLSTVAAGILFGVLIRSMILTVRRRRAHRMLLDLLTAHRPGTDSMHWNRGIRTPRRAAAGDVGRNMPDPDVVDVPPDVRILDHRTAVAYTLPGWHSRVVLSVGMLDLLGRDEVLAVIDHERAHVRSRHDLLVLPFQAWAAALGWLPGVRAAAESVAELTEMLADDWAARRSTAPTLAKALATVALAGVCGDSGVAGSQTPAVAGRSVAARVNRLLHPFPPTRWQVSCVYAVAGLLLAIPAVLLLIGWN